MRNISNDILTRDQHIFFTVCVQRIRPTTVFVYTQSKFLGKSPIYARHPRIYASYSCSEIGSELGRGSC